MDTKKRILIVDDDPDYRESIVFMFDHLQFLHAGSVSEALQVLQENADVQVVILDLKLGEIKGTALLEALKDQKEKYRVIVLTAYDSLLAAQDAAAYGVFSYVVKNQSSFREALLFHINDAFTHIEKAWLGRKVDAHLEIVRKVNRLGLGPDDNEGQELKEVLELVCDRALELLDAYTCHIRLLDPGRGDFVLWAARGRTKDAGKIFDGRVPPNRAYSGLAAETRERLIIPDLQIREDFIALKTEAISQPLVHAELSEYLNEVRSALIDPISTGIFRDDVDAIFNINSNLEEFFSSEQKQELVDEFVTQTNLAITKYRLKKKRTDIHEDYRNIGEMLEQISSVLIAGEDQLEEIYKIAFDRISWGLGPEIISIFLFDKASETIKNVAEYRGKRWVGPRDEQYSRGVGIVGRVFGSGATRIFATKVDEKTGEIDETSLPEGYKEEKIKDIPSGRLLHYLAVPIKFDNITIGVIRAVNKKSEHYDLEHEKTKTICLLKRGFSEDCRTELEITASHLAATIKYAELISKLNKTVRELESIYKVGEVIGFGQDMDAAFDVIVESVRNVMHAEICMLFRMNKEGDRIYLKRCSGMPFIEGAFYEVGEGKTGGVAENGEWILEEQADKDHVGKYQKEIDEFLRGKYGSPDKRIESFMAVPLQAKGRILGVIKVINKLEPPYHFEQKDVRLFQLFDSQIGLERFLYTQRYLELLVENSPLPIIYLNKNGRVEIFNKACEELWGYTSNYAIGRSVVDFYLSEEQAREIGKMLWQGENNSIHDYKTEIRSGDGSKIPVELSASILFDDDKRTNRIGSMGVFKDRREIIRYEDQAQQTEWDAHVGRLADTVSHKTTGNISTAQTLLGSLRREAEAMGRQTTKYDDINDALNEAITDLIGLTRIPNPSEPTKEPTYVSQIFEAPFLGSFARVAMNSEVEFKVDYSDAQSTLLHVDVKQIEEVIRNFFNNSLHAIKHRAPEAGGTRGLIEVIAKRIDGRVDITWRDNGRGIDPQILPDIFQLYFTHGKEHGTGLGLFRVERIMENHGGKVSVESVVGQGTTFTLQLPVSQS